MSGSTSLHGFTLELHSSRWRVSTTSDADLDVVLGVFPDLQSTIDVITSWLTLELPTLVAEALSELQDEAGYPFTVDGEARYAGDFTGGVGRE